MIIPFQGVPDDDQEQGSRDWVDQQVGDLPVVDFTAASGVVGQVGPRDVRRQPNVLLPDESEVSAHVGRLRRSSS